MARDRFSHRPTSRLAIPAWRGTGPRPTVSERRRRDLPVSMQDARRPSPYGKMETQRRTMKIRINGEDKNVNAELTLYELLLEIGLDPTQPGIAVAVNREVVPQAAWHQKKIDENSEVEIIRAVQGG